ncbi:hypothetical protein FRB95_002348 [Tulasnella sp. JGI-2019a]|nr:hypothetical protein FRB95_002348 [Tulasnella sp. JGI-2019a]
MLSAITERPAHLGHRLNAPILYKDMDDPDSLAFGGNPTLWIMDMMDAADYSDDVHIKNIINRSSLSMWEGDDASPLTIEAGPNTDWSCFEDSSDVPSIIQQSLSTESKQVSTSAVTSPSSSQSSTLYKECGSVVSLSSFPSASPSPDSDDEDDRHGEPRPYALDTNSAMAPLTHAARYDWPSPRLASASRKNPQTADKRTPHLESIEPQPPTARPTARPTPSTGGKTIWPTATALESDVELPDGHEPNVKPKSLLKRSRLTGSDLDSDYEDGDGDGRQSVPKRKKTKIAPSQKRSMVKPKPHPTKKARPMSRVLSVASESESSTRKWARTCIKDVTSVANQKWWWKVEVGKHYRCMYGTCAEIERIRSRVHDLQMHFESVHAKKEASAVHLGHLKLEMAFAYLQDIATQIMESPAELANAPSDVLRRQAFELLLRLHAKPPSADFTGLPELEEFATESADGYRVFQCKYYSKEDSDYKSELRVGKVMDDLDPFVSVPWRHEEEQLKPGDPEPCNSAFSTVHKRRDHQALVHMAPSRKGKS